MKLEYRREQLKDGGKTIANIRGDKLRKGTGSSTLCNVRDDKVRRGTGSSTLCNGTGSSRKAKVKDIKRMIKGSESLSDVFVAAIWQTFIR